MRWAVSGYLEPTAHSKPHTAYSQHAAALGRLDPHCGSKANRTTDSSLFSVNEDGKAEGEKRKSENLFRFPHSDLRFF